MVCNYTSSNNEINSTKVHGNLYTDAIFRAKFHKWISLYYYSISLILMRICWKFFEITPESLTKRCDMRNQHHLILILVLLFFFYHHDEELDLQLGEIALCWVNRVELSEMKEQREENGKRIFMYTVKRSYHSTFHLRHDDDDPSSCCHFCCFFYYYKWWSIHLFASSDSNNNNAVHRLKP